MHRTRHIDYFDWIRAFACVAVVLIHLCATYAGMASVDDMGFGNAVRNMFVPTVLARWAVPLFFMMTGALLLDPERPLEGRRLWGYIARMLAVMATFGLFFSLLKHLADDPAPSLSLLGSSILGVLDGSAWGHLWYVGALIGLYLVTPFVKAFTDRASVGQVEVALLVIYALGCVVPLINALTGLTIRTFFPVPYEVFYFLLGHYAHALIERGALSRRFGDVMRPVVAAGVVSLAAMLAAIVVCILFFHFDGYIFTDPLSPLVGPYALMIFMLFKRHADRPVTNPVVGVLSAHCFGIYIVHPVFTRVIKLLGWQTVYMAMPPLVGEAVFTAAIVALTAACVWVLNRTRFCREFLRL